MKHDLNIKLYLYVIMVIKLHITLKNLVLEKFGMSITNPIEATYRVPTLMRKFLADHLLSHVEANHALYLYFILLCFG